MLAHLSGGGVDRVDVLPPGGHQVDQQAAEEAVSGRGPGLFIQIFKLYKISPALSKLMFLEIPKSF